MLRTIKVYGHLAEHCGKKTFKALARTPAEAVRFLVSNYPGLRALMRDGYYTVSTGAYSLELGQSPEQLGYPLSGEDEIKIIPVISGANFFRNALLAIAGAALIATAIATGGAGLTFGITGFSKGIGASAAVGNLGVGLALTGVAGFLTPTIPTPDIDNDPRNNFNFSGVQNTSREGIPVPVAYGEVIVGSVVISSGLNVDPLE
jgi:predicted phage tail protein|tara:strand:- start:307 stop:918 length:612 start_codon:yes stop_codon:yes gene_type:complete